MIRALALLALVAPAVAAAAPQAAAQAAAAPADDHGLLLAPKLALDLPPNGLGAAALGALEVGYRLPWLERRFVVALEATLAQPGRSGTLADPRLAAGVNAAYDLSLRQLGFALVAMYRQDRAWRELTPYGGLGPTLTLAHAETTAFGARTIESEGKAGLLALAGAEWELWRGGPFLEARYHFTRVDLAATGAAAAGGLAVATGWRFRL
jgi:hypothetical protein